MRRNFKNLLSLSLRYRSRRNPSSRVTGSGVRNVTELSDYILVTVERGLDMHISGEPKPLKSRSLLLNNRTPEQVDKSTMMTIDSSTVLRLNPPSYLQFHT